MNRRIFAAMLPLLCSFPGIDRAARVELPGTPDAGGVLQRLAIANFGGSGQNKIQALATDANGNIFVAGTTNSPDFPVKNAIQPALGETSVLRTTDLGNTWTGVPAPLDVSAVYPDPVSAQILFGGGRAGIYKSANAGQTWQVIYPFAVGVSLRSLAIDPGSHLRIAADLSDGSLVRSLDGGATWASVCPLLSCGGKLIADPGGSGALAMSATPLYISRDWGLTFTQIQTPGLGMPGTVAFDASHPGWIYVDVAAGSTGTLWLSMDFGVTWASRASPPTIFTDIMGLAVDPNIPTTLVAATADGFYLSTDGAASWKLTGGLASSFRPDGNYPFVLLGRECAPGGGLFAIGSGGLNPNFTVAFSPDDGMAWNAPHLTYVTGVTAGPGCVAYATRSAVSNGSDAFVAKLAPDGEVLWATFLGGSDQELVGGLALDAQGNAYVAGTTYSLDFPSTIPRIGVQGQSSVFVTKFWPGGTLAYSVLIGGEASNTASALAIDSGQNAYVIGSTNSMAFPVTPGAWAGQLTSGSYTGFLVKLSTTGAQTTGTYLGSSYLFGDSIAVGIDDEPIVTGRGTPPGLPAPPESQPNYIMKLDRTASQVMSAAYISGLTGGSPALVATAPDGNVIVVGDTDDSNSFTAGAYVSPTSFSECGLGVPSGNSSGGLYVAKLRATDWQPVYASLIAAACGVSAGSLVVDGSGTVVLGLAAGAGLPLRDPLLAGPSCSLGTSAVAKLSPDGSALEFATYLDDCDAAKVALANDGSVYAGVDAANGAAGVLRLPGARPGFVRVLSLESISNAFSGDSNAVVGGGLYTITGAFQPGFQPPAVDLGLNPTQNLPTELAGVQVKFGGVPAAIVRIAPGQVTVVAPEKVALPADAVSRQIVQDGRFTTVQLFYNGIASSPVFMPVTDFLPGLLTRSYPNPQPLDFADGNVRNQDGTLNDANHPAPAGSTITIFATGLGATMPPTSTPGAIATSTPVVPAMPLYSTWQSFSFNASITPYPSFSVPGFVSAMFQIQIQVPADISTLGTAVGNGVQSVNLGLRFGPPLPDPTSAISNLVNVYVK